VVGNNVRQFDFTRIVGFRAEYLGLPAARNATPFGFWGLVVWDMVVTTDFGTANPVKKAIAD